MTVLTVFCFVFVCPYPGGRGEGVLNKFIYWGEGGGPPGGPTHYPFRDHFSRKRYPFQIPSIHKWYAFCIPRF